MNCLYELNAVGGAEQEARPPTQYHSNGYTTLASPSAATNMMMMESSAANNGPDAIKQSGEILMVSIVALD